MCNRGDLLVGYIYDEISEHDRRDVEAHLVGCAECRDEVAGLRFTRGHLAAWAPPQPELGFRIVSGGRSPAPVPALPRRRLAPAFGFAAAAVLVMAAAVSVANIEVIYGTDGGVTVRTGWGRTVQSAVAADQGRPSDRTASTAAVDELNRRLGEIERVFAEDRSAAPETQTVSAERAAERMSDAEMLRQVRAIVREAESRQETAITQRLLQVAQDFDLQRRADFARIQQGLGQYQGLTNAEIASQRDLVNQLIRASNRQER